jgi:DNA-binding transcriptional LysR family regulator
MLDLYKLHIFSVVTQEGSFSAAAEHLYMTQSAVSQHIKELEVSLGRLLFQRGWRGVKLTPHGEVLKCYASEIFELVARTENALMDIEHLTSGRISIGATPGLSVYLVPDWVLSFRARYPQITVALQTGTTSQIVSDVLAQRLEIGFIEGELNDHYPPRLSSLILEEIEQQVVVGFKNRFWDYEAVGLEDLQHQSMIVREAHSHSRLWLEERLHHYAIETVIGAEFDNLESIKRAVSLGPCLAVLPPYVAQAEVAQGLLHMIPVRDKPFTRNLKVIWNSRVPFSTITRAFLTELSQRYSALNGLMVERVE